MLKALYDPDGFFRENRDPSFAISISIVIVSCILSALAVYMNMGIIKSEILRRLTLYMPQGRAEEVFESIKYFMISGAFISGFIGWVILSALVHMISSLLGGYGEFVRTMKVVAFGYLPKIVLFPVGQALISMTQSLVNPAVMLVGIASTAWEVYILTFGVKNARDVSTDRAFVSVVVSVVVLVILGILGKVFRHV